MALSLSNTKLTSRAWRLKNLYTIRDDKGALVPFVPNRAQREFYNRMWYCNHILKARKQGFSTFIEILYLDDLLFGPPGLTVGIVDYKLDGAKKKLAMFYTAWKHLDHPKLHPETCDIGKQLKHAFAIESRSSMHLKFKNGSEAFCDTALRGDTPNRLHISELGKTAIFFPVKATEIINGAFNSMTPGNVRNIESTHEGGKLGEHYRLLQIAMKNDDANLTEIDSRFHFFPWWKDPRYVLPVTGGIAIRPEMAGYFDRLHCDHNIVLTPEQKLWYDRKQLEQGHGMKKEFPSTAGEAFEAISENAIYGKEMADLRAAGRIVNFGPEPHLPMFCFYDIGLSDYTAIWLIQPVGRWFLVLDWFEVSGKSAGAVADHIRQWEAKYSRTIAGHYLPHDADVRDKGTGKSYAQTLRECGVRNVTVVPRTPDVWLGIGYVRELLPHCWIHYDHCDAPRTGPDGAELPSGVACLEGYQRNVSASGMTLREMPKHDHFSHSADAFRTFAEAWRRGMVNSDTHSIHQPRAIGGTSKPRARR